MQKLSKTIIICSPSMKLLTMKHIFYCNDAEYTVFKINYEKQITIIIPVNISSSIQSRPRRIIAKDDPDSGSLSDNR